MEYRISIDLANAAFCDGNQSAEVARILRDLADECEHDDNVHGLPLRDINGNRVGQAKIIH